MNHSALASAEPIPQVGVDFGTPTGTLQLGNGNVIPNTFQTGDAKTIPPAATPTFTLGDGNIIPNTLSTGDSGSQTGSPGPSTEQPYTPSGTFVTGDGPVPPIAPVTVDTPLIPEAGKDEDEAEQE